MYSLDSLKVSISPNNNFDPLEVDEAVEKETDGLLVRVDPDREGFC